MTTIIERLRTALSPSAWDGMAERAAAYEVMRTEQPWLWTRADVFRELDTRTIDLWQRMRGWDTVYGQFPLSTLSLSEEDRIGVVQRSRLWAAVDPLISHAIRLWTAYGFGQEVSITPKDEGAPTKLWDEYWTRNERVFGDRDIHALSNSLLTDGEIWLACYIAKQGGDITTRVWTTEEIVDVVTLPDDKSVPLLYKRQWHDSARGTQTRYYRDYQATEADLESVKLPEGSDISEQENGGTLVLVMPVQWNRFGAVSAGWPRGWPLPTAALDWAQAYRQFCQDRAAVARKFASEVEEFRAKGGSRAIDMLKRQRESSLNVAGSYSETNPPPGAGSERWMNEAIESKRLSMATGAQDAAADSMLLMGQVATAMGLPAFMLGRTDMLQNRATAESAMRPTLRMWTGYQNFWTDVFADLFNLVLDAKEKYGTVKTTYPERGVQVDLSNPLDTEYQTIWESLVQYWDRGMILPRVLSEIALSQPELGLSSDVQATVLAAMYPEERSREVNRAAVKAILTEIAKGHKLEPDDIAALLEADG